MGPRVSILTRHLDLAARRLLAERLSARKGRGRVTVISRIPAAGHWDLVVVDARGIDAKELAELARHGLVACLDEGGEARDFASFTIDTLPGLPGRSPANLSDPSYLVLPRRLRRPTPRSFRTIILSLGGEDHEHLGEKLAAAMIEAGICDPRRLTVVEGPLAGARAWPAGVVVVQSPSSMSRLLARHDLLITHFGMTAFEALAVGDPCRAVQPDALPRERSGRPRGSR